MVQKTYGTGETDREMKRSLFLSLCRNKKAALRIAIKVSKSHLKATISGHLLVQYDVSKTIVLTEAKIWEL